MSNQVRKENDMHDEAMMNKAFDAAIKLMRRDGYNDVSRWDPEIDGIPMLLTAKTVVNDMPVVVIAQVNVDDEYLPDDLLITRKQFEKILTRYVTEHPEDRGAVSYDSYDFHVLGSQAIVKVNKNLFR